MTVESVWQKNVSAAGKFDLRLATPGPVRCRGSGKFQQTPDQVLVSTLATSATISLNMSKHANKKQKVFDDVEMESFAASAGFEDDPVGDEGDAGPSTSQKPSAWTDDDDTTLQVSLTQDKRRRKLRDALAEDTVDGRDYERRLRSQFQKINPTPDWATKARKRLHGTAASKRRRSSSDSEPEQRDQEESPEEQEDVLLGTGSVLPRPRSKVLALGNLSIERLRDANLSAQAEGEIKVIRFHPSPQVPVLLAASSDRRLRLFNVCVFSARPYDKMLIFTQVDGHTNPHLQTLHVPTLPFTNATFHPGGTSVLLTGPRPFYYTYDLQTGTAQRSPRGLWGTTFADTSGPAQDGSMEICQFDPTGSVLAVAGRRGHVHLVDWRAGSGQVVGSVKMNAGAKSLWWSGDELLTLGEDSEVYVWDVGQRRCIRRWKDDGGYGSQIIEGDRASKYMAVG